ncbi:MAG: response regulator [Planctomycetota bacterium]|jgi:signal transduction histidine kinase|nr:response regulator [Planctomycetota bacterium]
MACTDEQVVMGSELGQAADRALVLEDDPILAELLAGVLVREGFNAVVTGTVAAALAQLEQHEVELVLLDYQLPDGDGATVLEALVRRAPSVPIIVVTGHGDERLAVRMMQLGASDYLVKDADLRSNLRLALTRARSEAVRRRRLERLERQARDDVALRQVLLDALPTAAVLLDRSGMVLAANARADAGRGMRGRRLNDPMELLGAIGEEATVRRRHHEALAGAAVAGVEVVVADRCFDLQWQPVSVGLVLLMARDVTEARHRELQRDELEREIERGQRLEALGTFAGGVAHEFNNLLGTIIGSIDLLRMNQVEVGVVLDPMASAAARARELVRQLLIFARDEHGEREQVDLVQVVEAQLDLVTRLVGGTSALRYERPDHAVPVAVDVAQLTQALMHLVSNARHAMATTERDAEMVVSITSEDGLAVLSVRDNGCGIDELRQHRIFEPFYSTKPPGQGTGLGLAAVDGIVKRHGGVIAVESGLGRGTTVRISLPLAAETAPASTPSMAVRSYRLLLVDDEPVILDAMGELLRASGCRVHLADSPDAAVTLLSEDSSRFDAVITDMNMPGTTGTDFPELVRARWPGLPLVVMSGYLENVDRQRLLSGLVDEILDKPCSARAILRAVDAVLNRRQQASGPQAVQR